MATMLTKQASLKDPTPESRTARFVFSTDTVDRDFEVVAQNWNLDNYFKNPIALYAHDRKDLPIGKTKEVGVVDGKLQGTIVFASADANPKAEQVWQLYKEGILRSVSVGFIPRDYRFEMREGQEILVFDQNELLEISIVPVPANAEAVSMAIKSIDKLKSVTTANGGAKEKEMDLEDKAPIIADGATDKDEKINQKDLEIQALKGRIESLENERKDLLAKAEKMTVALVERDIDSLIGKKITAAEKSSLLKLASVSRELFDETLATIKARPDMVLLDNIITDKEPSVALNASDDGKSLADLANTVAFGR